MRDENERFWIMDLDEDPNLKDLRRSIDNGELVGLVDEESGGIIAYLLQGKEVDNRAKEILDLLNKVS